MKSIRTLTVIISIFFSVSAQSSDLTKKICSRTRAELFEQFRSAENRLAITNGGGLFQGGVCWWHSRLQRSSVYLAHFSPEKQKPDSTLAKEIIRKLIHFEEVVEVPGYENFYQFSQDFSKLVQSALNEWQIRDGFINQQWIRGISGRNHLSALAMTERMNQLYETYLRSEPGLWIMIQMKGITSHALLVLDLRKNERGYDLVTIDSNFPDTTMNFHYQEGDTSLHYGGSTFVPYAGFHKDQLKINEALEHYCSN
jgi:hypothetical protein